VIAESSNDQNLAIVQQRRRMIGSGRRRGRRCGELAGCRVVYLGFFDEPVLQFQPSHDQHTAIAHERGSVPKSELGHLASVGEISGCGVIYLRASVNERAVGSACHQNSAVGEGRRSMKAPTGQQRRHALELARPLSVGVTGDCQQSGESQSNQRQSFK
jgi:hypothetical protein